jgi:2'-5' RNA ligase
VPFAIELFFDPKSDVAVQRLGQVLEKQRIPSIFSTIGATPHISLAVFEQYDPQRLHPILKKLSSDFPPPPFRLSGLGTFPGKEGVIFLLPVVTTPLLQIHSWLHQVLPQAIEGNWNYYMPGVWVPHCTLCVKLTSRQLSRGLELMRQKFAALSGRFNQVALVEVHPRRAQATRLIYSIPFSGKKK